MSRATNKKAEESTQSTTKGHPLKLKGSKEKREKQNPYVDTNVETR